MLCKLASRLHVVQGLIAHITIRCIDQTSTTERNHQVRLMDAVYSNASQVLLYLGFRYPETISGFLRYLDRRSRGIIAEDIWFDESLVKEFLQHPYFNRVWVLQEISLAKLVALYTDFKTIHWDAHTVRELMILCNVYKHDPPGVLNWLPATRRDEHDCLDLLRRARRCMATDPRDKIFALYGFLPISFREALPINYAVDTEEVYWNIATHLISTTRRLDVLKHVCPYQPLDVDSVPSWVPDWKMRDFIYMELPKFTVAQMSKLAAFSSSRMSIETSSNAELQSTATHASHNDHQTQLSSPRAFCLRYRSQHTGHHHPTLRSHAKRSSAIPCLRVRGCFLDTVTKNTYQIPSHRRRWDSRFEQGPFFNSDVCRSCYGSKRFIEGFGRPFEQRSFEQSSFDPFPYDQHSHEQWLSKQRWCDLRPSEQRDVEQRSFDYRADYEWRQLWSVREVMENLPNSGQGFKTQQSVGFALCSDPHESSRPQRMRTVEPKDTVWAIEGLDVPVILRRRTQDGEAHYIFIGPCYLHRAGLDQECPVCGSDSQPWSMEYATIDIW